MSRCGFTATKWCCFIILDPQEVEAEVEGTVLLVDLETDRDGSVAGIREDEYRRRSSAHIDD